MPDSDSYVKCDICGKTKEVAFSVCLRKGWPTCCEGKTMRLLRTEADIDAAVGKAVSPVRGFFRA